MPFCALISRIASSSSSRASPSRSCSSAVRSPPSRRRMAWVSSASWMISTSVTTRVSTPCLRLLSSICRPIAGLLRLVGVGASAPSVVGGTLRRSPLRGQGPEGRFPAGGVTGEDHLVRGGLEHHHGVVVEGGVLVPCADCDHVAGGDADRLTHIGR